jgi:predicted PurR-regulated permease PerM
MSKQIFEPPLSGSFFVYPHPEVHSPHSSEESTPMHKAQPVSYAIMAAAILAALFLKLIPAAIAGMLVFTLTKRLSATPQSNPIRARRARAIAIAVVFLTVLAALAGIGLATAHFIESKDGLERMFALMADILEKIRLGVPVELQSYIPASVSDAQASLVDLLQQHSDKISAFGVETLASVAVIFLALIAGGLVSWFEFDRPENYRPLSGELLKRFTALTQSFEKVVFAQIKISLVNTALTSLYLLGVLRLFGWHLPLTKSVLLITFLCGMLPVIGNLVSNSIIVILSLGVSPKLALISLAFLIGIHKTEYLLNARIIGQTIQASAWELIISMIVLERTFGLAGLVAAPILYAYLKHELNENRLIGRWPKVATSAKTDINTP